MHVTETPSGLAVAGFGQPKKEEPKPEKPRQYFVDHYDRLDEVVKLLNLINERGAMLVSIARHGETHGILAGGIGYVVAYWHHGQLAVERKT